MSFSTDESIYGFVSHKMSLWPRSDTMEYADLILIHADMITIKLLNDRGIGIGQTASGVTRNEWHVLKLATRLGYCSACGRFASTSLTSLRDEIVMLGREICSKYFDSSMAEAIRFVAHEPEFINEQRIW